MNVPRYRSGEKIQKGDRVLFHGEKAEIELVATNPQDAEQAWYVKEFGGGILISEPKHFGRAFLRSDEIADCADLQFVSRMEPK